MEGVEVAWSGQGLMDGMRQQDSHSDFVQVEGRVWEEGEASLKGEAGVAVA